MIEYVKGDVLEAPAGSIIVHGCNTAGVMGSGVALAVKNKFPGAFEVYVREHYERGLDLGSNTYYIDESGIVIVNAITQKHYGRTGQRYVNYEAVAQSFDDIIRFIDERRFFQEATPWDTIAFPKIGAGLGGGNWNIIQAIIDEAIPDTWKKVCYEL